MWALRVLNGNQAGAVFMLTPGKSIVGRGMHCNVRIDNANISKSHCEILATDNTIAVNDLGSANGTFVNGVRVTRSRLQIGDKLGLFDIICEVLPAPKMTGRVPTVRSPASLALNQGVGVKGPANPIAFSAGPSVSSGSMVSASATMGPLSAPPESANFSSDTDSGAAISGPLEKAKRYFENAFLPPFYQMLTRFDLSGVLLIVFTIMVALITGMSIVPLTIIGNSAAEKEGLQRALTTARFLRNSQEKLLFSGNEHLIDLSFFLNQEGVEKAWIISARDGSIMHPADRSGGTPEYPWVQQIRKKTGERMTVLEDGKIAAAVPMVGLNPETGALETRAWSVVIYTPSSILNDQSRMLSLLIENFIIGSLIALLLYFLVVKMIEKPIYHLNEKLDEALRSGLDHVDSPYKFSALTELSNKINSILTRLTNAQAPSASTGQREMEYLKIVRMTGFPSFVVSPNNVIWCANDLLSQMAGAGGETLSNRPLQTFAHLSWFSQLQEVVESAKAQTFSNIQANIELGGHRFQLVAQALLDNQSQVEAILLVIVPEGMSLGGAA